MKKITLLFLLFTSCTLKTEKLPDELLPGNVSEKIIIYQLLPRLFSNTTLSNIPYGTIEQNGVGKLNDINEKALGELKNVGATHIWYTGVIEHATLTDNSSSGIPPDDPHVVKGRAGSPYAIKDYYDIAPDLAVDISARMQEFEALVNRTHQAGLKVIIDFIPNHVARQYHSDSKPKGVHDLGENDDGTIAFTPSNNFYYIPGKSFLPPTSAKIPWVIYTRAYIETPAKVTGNNTFTESPSVDDWYETVKLNFGVDFENGQKYFDPRPDTWLKMRDILLFWAKKKVDGFRCDMAEMVPVEFWEWVIPEVKKINPDILFIAEIYNPDLYSKYLEKGQFDLLYDKVQLYDTLRKITTTGHHINHISKVVEDIEIFNSNLLHFMENHDEQRIASRFFAGHANRGLPAVALSALIDKGAFMLYFGQEVGEPALWKEGFSGDDGRTTLFDYWGVPEFNKWVNNGKYDGGLLSEEQNELRSFYTTLLHIAQHPSVVWGNTVILKNNSVQNENESVYAFIRSFGKDMLLVVLNFGQEEVQTDITLSTSEKEKAGISTTKKYRATELISALDTTWQATQWQVNLRPYQVKVFELQERKDKLKETE